MAVVILYINRYLRHFTTTDVFVFCVSLQASFVTQHIILEASVGQTGVSCGWSRGEISYISWHMISSERPDAVTCSPSSRELLITICSFIHVLVCLTTGPKHLPKRVVHIVRSRASSFKWEYYLLSLTSSSSFLRLLPRLPVTYIPVLTFLQ